MNRREFLVHSAYATAPWLAAAAAPTAPDAPGARVGRCPRFGDDRDWFFQARFGLFVHWGLYAIRGFHEQEQWRARVPRSQYVQLAGQWNPQRFDPDEWLDLMQEVGMRYLCFTTKHHDGFCMWATKQTPFNVMNTPYGRDILRMLADACHRRNVPLCLYYSIVDWNHPAYPNQGRHHELPPQPGDQPDWSRYLEFLKAQVQELCTEYGRIHGFWWDMNVPEYRDPTINQAIRRWQPGIIINNRGFDEGDFGTPERDYDARAGAALAFERPTEACQSVGMESWGWRVNEDYYSLRHLQRSVAAYLARDANYLLNVGPMPDGRIPDRAVRILRAIGDWFRRVREALIDVEPVSHWTTNRNVLLTRRGRTLYVILHKEIPGEAVKLTPLNLRPRSATLLNTGRPVSASVELLPSDHATQRPVLRVHGLPVDELAHEALVVRLDFDHDPNPPAQT